jgi:hypothetical protein
MTETVAKKHITERDVITNKYQKHREEILDHISAAKLTIAEYETKIKPDLHPTLALYFASLIRSNTERIQQLTQLIETLDICITEVLNL